MSGKIEISRELAADLTRKIITQEDHERRVAAREELRALLSAPVVERQEPVAWLLCKGDEQPIDSTIRWDVAKHWPELAEPLYTSPPAPVSVVLPERADENDDSDGNDPHCEYPAGWNACLDKVKELNQ